MYSLLRYVLLHPELPLYPSYQRNPGLMPRPDRSSRSILHDCWVCLFVCFSHCKTESKLLPDRVPWRLKLPYLSPIGCSTSYLFSHILLRLSSLGSLQPLNAISPCRLSDSQQSVLTACLSGLPPPILPHRRVLPQAPPPNRKLLPVAAFASFRKKG